MASPDVPSPDAPLPGVPDGTGSDRGVLRVRDPGQLVAAVPVLLGFHPRESLVLVSLGGRSGRRIGLTVRADLPAPEHVGLVAESAVESLLADEPAGAAVIVVGAACGADPPHRELVELVAAMLEEYDIAVHGVIRAEHTAGGARWWCYDACGCHGVLPDPSATPLAACAVAEGQVVYADRAELERTVAPAEPERIRRREQLLVRRIDTAAEGLWDAEPGGDGEGRDPEVGTAVVDAAIADAAAGRLEIDDERVLALAEALAVPAVRDTAIRRCAGRHGAAAEHLWAALVRETPDPEAAAPATLLAVSALLRGDGALANVALDRAERAWPGHRLTRTLRAVADAGIRPRDFRACVQSSLAAPPTRRAAP